MIEVTKKKKFFEILYFNSEYICIKIGKLRFLSYNKDCFDWGFADFVWDDKYNLMMHFDTLSTKSCMPPQFVRAYSDPDDGIPEWCVYRISNKKEDISYCGKLFSTNWFRF